MEKLIDLRSDTVTKPTPEMLSAMMSSELGDDLFGEDPTVIRLEEEMASRVGMEAAVFVSSGTQSNLLGIMSHCERGDEYIAGQEAHLYRWEAGGAAVLGSVQPQPVEFEKDGTLNLKKVEKYIKPDDFHFARTKLLCLENTHSGKVLPLPYFAEARAFAHSHGLRMHLDGARVFNAAVKQKVDVREITSHFDSVSVCLSKGLGAPVGSALSGSKDFIKKARRIRKMLGGGMRQAGILAGAGLYALHNNINRLEEDHENALSLAQGLSEIKELDLDLSLVQSNMVFVEIRDLDPVSMAKLLREKGIVVLPSQRMRLVTHLDVSAKDIKTAIDAFKFAVKNGLRKTETTPSTQLSGPRY